METPYGASVTPITPDTYNANALVQYKVIDGNSVTFPITKVADLEWELAQSRRLTENFNDLKGKVRELRELLIELYNPNYSKEEALEQIAQLFDLELSKTVTVTGTINFEVTVKVPLDDIENFDAHYKLGDELSLRTYGDDVEINDWTIEDTDVDWG